MGFYERRNLYDNIYNIDDYIDNINGSFRNSDKRWRSSIYHCIWRYNRMCIYTYMDYQKIIKKEIGLRLFSFLRMVRR